MKHIERLNALFVITLAFSLSFLTACSTDDSEENIPNTTLTQTDREALVFMLEEEKLARDTYEFLDNLWGTVQFSNIKVSEQSHMNALENLLIQYNVDYNILAVGEFENQDIQNLYDQFIVDGSLNEVEALKVGATIEDLDIVDLETNINATTNTTIITVFESLQCGSRNHLRSFVSAIEISGSTYTPQFLTQEQYNIIINASNESCN